MSGGWCIGRSVASSVAMVSRSTLLANGSLDDMERADVAAESDELSAVADAEWSKG